MVNFHAFMLKTHLFLHFGEFACLAATVKEREVCNYAASRSFTVAARTGNSGSYSARGKN